MANTTGIAVGCAVGVPCFLAFLIALYFFLKTRKRLEKEDLEFQKDDDIHNMNQDLHYDSVNELRVGQEPGLPSQHFDHSESSDDGKGISEKSEIATESGSPQQDKKKDRYVPAYRKKMKSSMTNLSNSRSSSLSNLQPPAGSQPPLGSNSSINSTNTNTTNTTDHFYSNVPVIDNTDHNVDSSHNSIELARSLQQPTPSYQKKPNPVRSSSDSIADEEYDLKNNYDIQNEVEIQEEDQYENEFTNYSENKRAFIEGLRPKREH